MIKGSSYTGKAATNNVVGNWWNHKLLQVESQISPISGSIKKQIITFIAKEKIKLYGKNFDTEHFKLKSTDMSLPDDKKLNFDIWFDKKSSINKILPFLSALKIQDYKNFIVSPYFQNVKLNNDSLIQPRKSINQYGNYSLFD